MAILLHQVEKGKVITMRLHTHDTFPIWYHNYMQKLEYDQEISRYGEETEFAIKKITDRIFAYRCAKCGFEKKIVWIRIEKWEWKV